MPTKWNLMALVSKEITPLTHGSLTFAYSPNGNLLIFVPSLTYSIASNWDIDLIGQTFFAKTPLHTFGNLGNVAYFRLKWSF
jgi:hypothetical protein